MLTSHSSQNLTYSFGNGSSEAKVYFSFKMHLRETYRLVLTEIICSLSVFFFFIICHCSLSASWLWYARNSVFVNLITSTLQANSSVLPVPVITKLCPYLPPAVQRSMLTCFTIQFGLLVGESACSHNSQ